MSFFRSRFFMRFMMIMVIILTLAVIVAEWWLKNDAQITDLNSRTLILGRLFGFLAAWSILLQLALMSRLPVVENNLDLQENITLHRYNGWFMVLTFAAHVVFISIGYAIGKNNAIQEFFLLDKSSDILLASLGSLVFFSASSLSLKAIKKHLKYEIWYFLHLLVYFAVLATFIHQISFGADFINNYWFTAYWYGLYSLVFILWLWYRLFMPAINDFRFRFKIKSIQKNGDNTYTVTLAGRNIEKYKYKSGQYATWRILTKDLWWEAHPFSINSKPGHSVLMFTFKSGPNFTERALKAKIGSRVLVDGPRGNFTADRAAIYGDVVLIAGGIGLAPYLSTVEQLIESGKKVRLLYAIKNIDNFSFANQLNAYKKQGLDLQVFLDSERRFIDKDVIKGLKLGRDSIVYICGPEAMTNALLNSLKSIDFPENQIITERFSF